jgi:hypothetical protein
VKGVDCRHAEFLLDFVFCVRNINLYNDFRPEDWSDGPMECEDKRIPPHLFKGKPAVCIRKRCESRKYSNHECAKLEIELEAAARQKFDLEVDYTTDEDVCGKH